MVFIIFVFVKTKKACQMASLSNVSYQPNTNPLACRKGLTPGGPIIQKNAFHKIGCKCIKSMIGYKQFFSGLPLPAHALRAVPAGRVLGHAWHLPRPLSRKGFRLFRIRSNQKTKKPAL